jgi:phosphatidate cytidylyltransferase
VSDRFEDEPRPRIPTEGVRILGAEEAQAALDSRARPPGDTAVGKEADDQDELEPILDLTPADTEDPRLEPRSEAAPQPLPARPHRFNEDGPSWAAATAATDDGPVPVDPLTRESGSGDPPSGELPLPHWTEPPTGAVPAIFTDADAPDEEVDVWDSPGSSPRFRAEGSDWAEADFGGEDLNDNTMKVGALAEASVVDDDETFERDIAERRRRTPRGRAARTMVTTPAPAGTPRRSPTRPTTEAEADAARDLVPPGAARSRDLPTAIATAAAVAVVALICFTQGTFWTALLASVIVGVGTLEFTAGLQARGFRPASALAMTGAFFLPLAARTFGANAYPVFFGLMVVFSMLWFLWEITPGRPLLGVAMTVFSFAYVGGLGGFAGLLLASRDGIGLILGVALCVITYDVVGFFVGSQFGKSPIAPRVSPNKSFEGTLAGMIGSVLMGWLLVGGAIFGGIAPWSPGKGAVLGLFVAAGAFLGDLCESMLKRDLGIKDFGSLLPGHGGVLDRFDALLFCLPITYFLAVHLNIL